MVGRGAPWEVLGYVFILESFSNAPGAPEQNQPGPGWPADRVNDRKPDQRLKAGSKQRFRPGSFRKIRGSIFENHYRANSFPEQDPWPKGLDRD